MTTTKQPTGWFLISNHDGVYSGIIAKMFMKPGEDPNAVCDQCKDDRLNHPWLGLEIIRGMQQEEADKYGGGTILDPRDGKVYKATLKVSPDGQTLAVRGYLGSRCLGKNTYWTRLPDSAYSMLDPSVNPNAAAKRPPASDGAGAAQVGFTAAAEFGAAVILKLSQIDCRAARSSRDEVVTPFPAGARARLLLARLTHQHRLEQRRRHHRGEQRNRQ